MGRLAAAAAACVYSTRRTAAVGSARDAGSGTGWMDSDRADWQGTKDSAAPRGRQGLRRALSCIHASRGNGNYGIGRSFLHTRVAGKWKLWNQALSESSTHASRGNGNYGIRSVSTPNCVTRQARKATSLGRSVMSAEFQAMGELCNEPDKDSDSRRRLDVSAQLSPKGNGLLLQAAPRPVPERRSRRAARGRWHQVSNASPRWRRRLGVECGSR